MAAFASRPLLTLTAASAAAAAAAAAAVTAHHLSRPVLADNARSPPKTFGRGPSFLSLPLESSELVSPDTKRLRFRLPDAEGVSGLPLTSSLLTMSWPRDSWTPVLRPYTPISSQDTPGHIDLLVKLYPSGRSSSHLHALAPSQTLFVLAPIAGPRWTPSPETPALTLIAGGAGITPIYQLAQGILRNPADKTSISLVFGVNTDADVLLKDELDAFEREFPGRFSATYVVSNPAEGSKYRKGRVTAELLREVVPAVGARDSRVFVCGPPAMERALVGDRKTPGMLAQVGYRKDQVQTF